MEQAEKKKQQTYQRDRFSDDSHLWSVMNTVLDGLIIIDNRGTIQAYNPAAEQIFGFSPEEVIGQNVKMLMPDPYSVEHDGYLTNYLETKTAKVIGLGREVSGKRKDGRTFPMELGVNEMWLGDQLMFVGTVRDISERKNAQEAMEAYIQALKRSNQELDDFAYIASHDLKEPLRGLSNNAIFLREDHVGQLNESGIKRIERMVYLCEKMEQLINELLYFSRIGKQELAVRSVDLNEIVTEIVDITHTAHEGRNIKFLIPEALPHVICDAIRIKEAFRNLVTNAIKYNDKEEKVIEIGVKKVENDKKSEKEIKQEKKVFYVKDNGIGIESRSHDEVFRIFKRLNDEDDSVKGTGVGLTFVKKIIERHGGRIWLESEVGKGTTFFFTIGRGIGV
ncbi:MAG: PAS domain S-box protein [Alphaproteobacteria bacterium]|nr:PAS domain S-box protein [Alphaproteobacteria bacterium]